MRTVFEGSFPNFNGARKADNAHQSSLMDSVGKEEMRVKRQLLWDEVAEAVLQMCS